mgnify:FL=1
MKYEKYNSIQYVSNNWNSNISNSIDCNYKGYKHDKTKQPSKTVYKNKNGVDISTIKINLFGV